MSAQHELPHAGRANGALLDARTSGIVELVAEGLTELGGFGVAALSLVDDEAWETVAVAGSEEARAALLGVRRQVSEIHTLLALADEWGAWRFVPAERLGPDDTIAWEPDLPTPQDEHAWRARDLLFAPIHDDEGVLRGMLSVDLPRDGRRPDEASRADLDRYAAQASRALLLALEQAELAERVRMLRMAQDVCRTASRALDMATADECRADVMRGFDAFGMWVHLIDKSLTWPGSDTIAPGAEPVLTAETAAVVEHIARVAWDRQEVVRMAIDRRVPAYLLRPGDEDRLPPLVSQFEEHRVATALFVPLGAGPECLGSLMLTRPHGARTWTDVECDVALGIGHDLGSALVNARAFAREQELVAEMLALDTYRSQLVATLAHELKNPLAAVITTAELLAEEDGLSAPQDTLLTQVRGSSADLTTLVDRLLVLARVQDPSRGLRVRPVDLRALAEEVVDRARAGHPGARLVLSGATDPVVVPGERTDLRLLLAELIDNAVRFSPSGAAVRVAIGRRGDRAWFAVTDQGPGVPPEEETEIFREFYVGSHHSDQAGPGLGLALAARIVDRHRGRLGVLHEKSGGSTFSVSLPLATDLPRG